MTAYTVVKFRVKPCMDQQFLDAHRNSRLDWLGLREVTIIKTGEGSYCLMGHYADSKALADARPSMIATLNTFRATLEDQGEGKGVTDAVSGEVVFNVKP